MLTYLIKRILLIFPTLIGIMLINFIIIQFVPGGPVEQFMAQLNHTSGGNLERLSNSFDELGNTSDSSYKGGAGLEQEILKEVTKRFRLDQPAHIRFLNMIKDYFFFDFGTSFFSDYTVTFLVVSKLPVSISLGLWTTLLIYLISIPLGISKAIRDGNRFDVYTSTILTIGYAIPNFLFAVLLIVFFAGGEYFSWFPLRGLFSENYMELPWYRKIFDYFHHLALPIIAMVVSGFASLTMLTKNSFIDQISQQYVITARAKGLTEKRILYGHIFRNAMLIVIAGFPGALVSILFTGSLIIEVIFSLDGLGLLGYESALKHDYPVVFGSLFFFSLLGLSLRIIADLTYTLVDPRIHFDKTP